MKQLQFNFVTENNILARIIKLENDSQRTEQRFAEIKQRFAGIEQRFAGIERTKAGASQGKENGKE